MARKINFCSYDVPVPISIPEGPERVEVRLQQDGRTVKVLLVRVPGIVCRRARCMSDYVYEVLPVEQKQEPCSVRLLICRGCLCLDNFLETEISLLRCGILADLRDGTRRARYSYDKEDTNGN